MLFKICAIFICCNAQKIQPEIFAFPIIWGLTPYHILILNHLETHQVDLLDVNNHAVTTPTKDLSPEDKQEVRVAQAGAKALWSISQSKKNRDEMRKAGCVRLLARLLKSIHGDVVVPIMGTLQQCASEVTSHSVMRLFMYLIVSKFQWRIRNNSN